MEEIWKTIEIAPNYEVSNLGRVRNRKGLILKPSTSHGYYHVVLMNNKKRISRNVHRLVAEAFIPNPNNYLCIIHKDECRTNNAVDNIHNDSLKGGRIGHELTRAHWALLIPLMVLLVFN